MSILGWVRASVSCIGPDQRTVISNSRRTAGSFLYEPASDHKADPGAISRADEPCAALKRDGDASAFLCVHFD